MSEIDRNFPRIMHIDDVLPFIDEDCFAVREKDDCGHTYINYLKMGSDTFPPFPTSEMWERYMGNDWDLHQLEMENHRAAIRRECRGIAFDTETGLLASRPFHKFFNIGENESMDVSVLDFEAQHWIMDKVDGSMLRPIWIKGRLHWATKMGNTDIAKKAEKWLRDKPRYEDIAQWSLEENVTPIFEYVGPHNRVVVDYKEDLILLALRSKVTGDYWTPPEVDAAGLGFGIPTVKTYDPIEGDPTIYLSAVRDSDDLDEGIVVRWPRGMGKLKTETYTNLHHVKESARTERTFVRALLDGDVDDLMPLLPEEDRAFFQRYIDRFWHAMSVLEDDIGILYHEMRQDYETKKEFAIASANDLTGLERKLVFALWDNKVADAQEAAASIIDSGLVSETKWAEMKQNIAMTANLNTFDAGWTREDSNYE